MQWAEECEAKVEFPWSTASVSGSFGVGGIRLREQAAERSRGLTALLLPAVLPLSACAGRTRRSIGALKVPRICLQQLTQWGGNRRKGQPVPDLPPCSYMSPILVG